MFSFLLLFSRALLPSAFVLAFLSLPVHGQGSSTVKPPGLAPPLALDSGSDDPITAAQNQLRSSIEQFLFQAQGETIDAFQHAVDTYHKADVPIPSVDTNLDRQIQIERRLGQLKFTSQALQVVAGLHSAAAQYRESVHTSQVGDLERSRDQLNQAISAQNQLFGSQQSPLLQLAPAVAVISPISSRVGSLPLLVTVLTSPTIIDSVSLLTSSLSDPVYELSEDHCTNTTSFDPPVLSPGTSCFVQVSWNFADILSDSDYTASVLVRAKSHPQGIAQTFVYQLSPNLDLVASWIPPISLPSVSSPPPPPVPVVVAVAPDVAPDPDLPDPQEIFPQKLRLLSLSAEFDHHGAMANASALLVICPDGSAPLFPCLGVPPRFVRLSDPLPMGWVVADFLFPQSSVVLSHPDFDDFLLAPSSSYPPRVFSSAPAHVPASSSGSSMQMLPTSVPDDSSTAPSTTHLSDDLGHTH